MAVFTQKLLKWHREQNTRSMPWKGETDPYRIWLSEIILQQTRVDQGLSYYQRFISQYPAIVQLAAAPADDVFKLWEGLGYYSRCRNLLETARAVTEQYGGNFPRTYEEIIALKGIGPYTAAAISSFAFGLPHAVVDGNVLRVLSRYFGVNTPIDSGAGRKMYSVLAQRLLPVLKPGLYNQAIMDFGAVICKPKQPLCTVCPQKNECRALQLNAVGSLPVKEKQLKRKTRWFYYIIVSIEDKVLIRQRTQKDIWQQLYEFVLHEEPLGPLDDNDGVTKLLNAVMTNDRFVLEGISPIMEQQLTHQTICTRFIRIRAKTIPASLKDYLLVKKSDLKNYAFPKVIATLLKETNSALTLF